MGIVENLSQRVGVSRACRALDMPRSSLYRSRQPRQEPKPRPTPPHALSEEERRKVREVLNSERFMDLPPRQVYATLLDEGTYLCHWRTMYRILAAHDEVRERRNLRQHPTYVKPQLLATAPNQVWSWDITVMRGPVKWHHFYLYTVIDIFSRYVVGWLIAERESSDIAKHLIAETVRKQGIAPHQLTLHADNGSPMKGKPLQDLLRDLHVAPSHSRPHTSDDNPFSEAQFKTMKYRPDYPNRFDSIDTARSWARRFFTWYNNDHYHSGLNLLTPASVHYGSAQAIQGGRQAVMGVAYNSHPERFMQGPPVVLGTPDAVYINPPQEVTNLT